MITPTKSCSCPVCEWMHYLSGVEQMNFNHGQQADFFSSYALHGYQVLTSCL